MSSLDWNQVPLPLCFAGAGKLGTVWVWWSVFFNLIGFHEIETMVSIARNYEEWNSSASLYYDWYYFAPPFLFWETVSMLSKLAWRVTTSCCAETHSILFCIWFPFLDLEQEKCVELFICCSELARSILGRSSFIQLVQMLGV